uniref:Uncharacterized protein n=1 Tax=Setaria digitata TaxID=48799 RepID=A0A915PX45_9BILA
MRNELLQLNSNIFYIIEIDALYPYDTKQCDGLQVTILDKQRNSSYIFKLDKEDQKWRAILYSKSEARHIVGDYQYEQQFKLSFGINNWKVKIKWNGEVVTFLNIHDKEELAFVTVQESCKLDRIAINEYLEEFVIETNETHFLTKLDGSFAEVISDETVRLAEMFYKDDEEHILLRILGRINGILIPGAVLAIVVNSVMTAIEIRNYELYQLAKIKPPKLVITREFLERIRIERCNAKKKGSVIQALKYSVRISIVISFDQHDLY